MPHTRLRPSFTFTEERLAELRTVIPEAYADGKINWETLREALCDWIEPEGAEAEHFGLFWPGKREARRLAAMPSHGTLVPVQGEGVNEETTRNLFIEGDNLEVLKLLQKSYAGRVKMIYVDPPYNTGNDFVYKDDFRDPLGDYLRKTGQADSMGQPLKTNTRADGRFHSNWLSMMYPRLRLARTLLADDGVIFVSIDDGEVAYLRLMLDEIFGSENFVSQIVWKSRQSEDTRAKTGVSIDHEYIVCYRRSDLGVLRGTEKDLAKFSNPDNDPRGPWRSADLTGLATRDRRPNLHYVLTDPTTGVEYPCPPKGWRYEPATMQRKIAEGRVLFPPDPAGRPRHKLFLNEMESTFKNISSVVLHTTTMDGTRELTGLVGSGRFDFPKPVSLVKLLVEQVCTFGDELVCDLFAGSGTTGHAVMALNAEDGGRRRFMLVQYPEVSQREKSEVITEVAKERLRHAIKSLKRSGTAAGNGDLGFRVLVLKASCFHSWRDYDGTAPEQLEAAFEKAETPLVRGWEADALLTEILLLQGFPLDARVEQLTQRENDVRLVTAASMTHRLWICLDKAMSPDTVRALDVAPEDVFVCLDSALDDATKLRLADCCTLKTI